MTAADRLAEIAARADEIAASHVRHHGSAGDGYTEPREQWLNCSCGASIWSWQQFYDETDDDPDVCWTKHIAAIAIRAALEAALGEVAP